MEEMKNVCTVLVLSGERGGVKLQVSCLCLTFNDLRDCFPCALQCAIAEIGVAARTWFDVSSCNKTQ